MKFEKKKPLTQLFLTDRLWSVLAILILIFGVILVFAFLAGLIFVLVHTPKWIFKYIFLILLGSITCYCVVGIVVNIKRAIMGLWLSSRLPLSEEELKEANVSNMKEYLLFLDKYIGRNKLYVTSEHLAFMSRIACCCEPLFLITESSVELESKLSWWRFNKNRFALYDLEEALKEYSRYGVETSSWRKTGLVLAINNAAIHKDVDESKILNVWGKPRYASRFGYRVTPRSDSTCIVRESKQLIQHKEHIGRKM